MGWTRKASFNWRRSPVINTPSDPAGAVRGDIAPTIMGALPALGREPVLADPAAGLAILPSNGTGVHPAPLTLTPTPPRSGRSSFLLFAPPSIGEEEIREVVDTLRSGWITTGPKTKLFEARLPGADGRPGCAGAELVHRGTAPGAPEPGGRTGRRGHHQHDDLLRLRQRDRALGRGSRAGGRRAGHDESRSRRRRGRDHAPHPGHSGGPLRRASRRAGQP